MIETLIAEDRLFINGSWREAADGRREEIISPVTERPLGSVAFAGVKDVDLAVEAAVRAFSPWAAVPASERGRYLLAIADHLASRADELARRTARNNGKPLEQGLMDVDDAVACYRYYAALVGELDAVPVADLPKGWRAVKDRLPLGPVALIVPWNFPLTTAAWKVAPALAAGCTVVLKASEVTPFAELALGGAASAVGLPPGVLNILVGGPECGEHLTRHPGIAKISFTGSNAVGAKVMAAAATRAVPITLELGGKSPIVIFEDVDLDEAARTVADGIFFNSGQVCSATSRLIVQESIADAIHERLSAIAHGRVIGDPLDPDTQLGPLTSAAQFAKVRTYLKTAEDEGLECIAGGNVVEGVGYFVQPTIYKDVPASSRLWREEIFGPVLVTARFRTEEEALALANDTDFGLGAVVLSPDGKRAARFGRNLRAGNVWINSPQVVFPQGSWGGFGASGFGRELGKAGLEGFTGIRQIITAGAQG
jgi:betaine-aldehyde dehydrogenase